MEWAFRQSVWLFPIVFVLHVLEEWPGFTTWAKKYASGSYTQRDYNTIHVAGVLGAIIFAAIVSQFPNRIVVFVFFAFVFAPGLLCNTVFHAGATLMIREYCPGVITAVTLYIPVFVILSRLALREDLLTGRSLVAAIVIATAFHTWEVGHNVFKAW